jgi:hypothetical protein
MSSQPILRLGSANAFEPPPVCSDVFDNPQIAKRNLLIGPGAWEVYLGVHKEFRLGERVTPALGADFDNVFNHPLKAPDFSDNGGDGGGHPFAFLGDFNVNVNRR